MRGYDLIRMGDNGVQETAGAASAAFAIPDNNFGRPAKRVAIRVSTASETMYVRPVVNGSGTVTAENGLPVNKEAPTVLDVAGYTHIAAIRQTNNVVFNITPLED